jgi:hypothetical protein
MAHEYIRCAPQLPQMMTNSLRAQRPGQDTVICRGWQMATLAGVYELARLAIAGDADAAAALEEHFQRPEAQ